MIRFAKVQAVTLWEIVFNMKSKYSGFTLIEVLIVIGIVGILLSISVLPFSKMVNQYKYRDSVQQIFIDLRQARAMSLSQNKIVSFVSDGVGYKLFDSSGFTINRVFDNVFISASPIEFVFHPSGRIDPVGMVEIDISGVAANLNDVIEVTSSGYVRIRRPVVSDSGG